MREGKIHARNIVAIDPSRRGLTRSLAGYAANYLCVPRLHRGNVGGVEVNVIHLDRHGEGRVAKELYANPVWSMYIALVRISTLIDLDLVSFPFGERRWQVFPHKTEVIHDGARRWRSGLSLPQHDENARELDHR